MSVCDPHARHDLSSFSFLDDFALQDGAPNTSTDRPSSVHSPRRSRSVKRTRTLRKRRTEKSRPKTETHISSGNLPAPLAFNQSKSLPASPAQPRARHDVSQPDSVPPSQSGRFSLPRSPRISPRVYEDIVLFPDDPRQVQYGPRSNRVIAATPARLIAYVTAHDAVDYDLLSDFFLIFRAFMSTKSVLRHLFARLRWAAVDRADDVGRVVRVRTFVAIRHWVLNYFADDFLSDSSLRAEFCDATNALYDTLSAVTPPDEGNLKIVGELKKCWRRVCVTFGLYLEQDDEATNVNIHPGQRKHGLSGQPCEFIPSEERDESSRKSRDRHRSIFPYVSDHQARPLSRPRPLDRSLLTGIEKLSSPISPGILPPTQPSLPPAGSEQVSSPLSPYLKSVPGACLRDQPKNPLEPAVPGEGQRLRAQSSTLPPGALTRGLVYHPSARFSTVHCPLSAHSPSSATFPSHPTSPIDTSCARLSSSVARNHVLSCMFRTIGGKSHSRNTHSSGSRRSKSGLSPCFCTGHFPDTSSLPPPPDSRYGTASYRQDVLSSHSYNIFQSMTSQDSKYFFDDRVARDGRFCGIGLSASKTTGRDCIADPDAPVPRMSRSLGKDTVMSTAAADQDHHPGTTSSSSSINPYPPHERNLRNTDSSLESPPSSTDLSGFVGIYGSDAGDSFRQSVLDSEENFNDVPKLVLPQHLEPTRSLRRRPGGNLRSVHNASDLEKRDGLLKPMLRSNFGKSFDSVGQPHRSDSTFSHLTPDAYSRPMTGFLEPDPSLAGDLHSLRSGRSISLVDSHSSQLVLRPSFQALAAEIAALAETSHGGVEEALMKLEGRDRPCDGERKFSRNSSSSLDSSYDPDDNGVPLNIAPSTTGMAMDLLSGFQLPPLDFDYGEDGGFRMRDTAEKGDDGVGSPRMVPSFGTSYGFTPQAGTNGNLIDNQQGKVTISPHHHRSPPKLSRRGRRFPDSGATPPPIAKFSAPTSAPVGDSLESADPAMPSPPASLGKPDELSPKVGQLRIDTSGLNESTQPDGAAVVVPMSTSRRGRTHMLPTTTTTATSIPRSSANSRTGSAGGRPADLPTTMTTAAAAAGNSARLCSIDAAAAVSHLPFILAFSPDRIAEQMTLIEQDVLNEVDWHEFVDLRWSHHPVDVRDWASAIVAHPSGGIDLVVARFNLVVKWVVSEVVLTRTLDECVATVVQFIKIADAARRMRNFATACQICIALMSSDLGPLRSAVWGHVPVAEVAVLREIEDLTLPKRNFAKLRSAMECLKSTDGCIPFVGIFTHDLVFNAQKPAFMSSRRHSDADPRHRPRCRPHGTPDADANADGNLDPYTTTTTTDPLINFERFRTAASIIKKFLRLLDASTRYEIAPDPDLLGRCLWISSLADDQIRGADGRRAVVLSQY